MNMTKPGMFLITPLLVGLLQGCGTTVVNPPGPGKILIKPGKKQVIVKTNSHRHGGKWSRKCHRHSSLGRHCH